MFSRVFIRYVSGSLVTAAVDYTVFLLAYMAHADMVVAVLFARFVALLANYLLLHFAVFDTRRGVFSVLPRYVMVVVASGLAATQLIHWMGGAFGIPAVWAKIGAETALYPLNYLLMSFCVFSPETRRQPNDGEMPLNPEDTPAILAPAAYARRLMRRTGAPLWRR